VICRLLQLAFAVGISVTPLAAESQFVERSAQLGVDFVHRHFGTGEKRMPENMGAGVAVFDADGDGRLDLYFVQGRPWEGGAEVSTPHRENRLYFQQENGSFRLRKTGAEDPDGYGMGVAFGDVDRDGDSDLYVTNFGRNRMFLNRGEGRFEAVTSGGALDVSSWSAGAGFFDKEGDGDLDLWVANYLDFDPAKNKWCGSSQRKIRSYCHPDVYDGVADVLLKNSGNGTFENASSTLAERNAADDKGLGLALLDLDGDGSQDVFVANDSTMNDLYLQRDGKLKESALIAGAAVNGKGTAEASMGVAVADVDGDTRPDLFVTHLDQETNTLYRNVGDGRFRDETKRFGLGTPSLPWVGFGTIFLDFDLDGDLDLFVANGHIIDNIEAFDPDRAYRQPPQLFENRGGRFVERSEILGVEEERWVGRGAIAADLDRDGDEEIVVTQNGGPVRVLINQANDGDRAFGVRLQGVESNRQGFGARIELVTEHGRQVRWMSSATSYLSQGPAEVYFGVGSSRIREVTVSWPSGKVDRFGGLDSGGLVTLREGGKVLNRLSFHRSGTRPSVADQSPSK